MKIAIATYGRFHVLDLARELAALGHDVRFYSCVPPWRTRAFGLPTRCNVTLFWLLLPLLLLDRIPFIARRPRWQRWFKRALNRTIDLRLTRCDVFIGMSGTILESAATALRRYHATIVVERGSTHVRAQRDVLAALPGAEQPAPWVMLREEAGYALADRISLPSTVARDSFVAAGVDPAKLMVNAYGVDLERFRPQAAAAPDEATLLFVGRWCLRKGADLVEAALHAAPELRLLHAGAIGDLAFPQDSRCVSLGHVDQNALPGVYARGHVLVLPSREEGFGLVVAQALACGVPVVVSEHTGARDIRAMIDVPDAVTVVPGDDVAALVEGIRAAMRVSAQRRGSDLLGAARRQLSWAAYAQRYAANLAAAREAPQ